MTDAIDIKSKAPFPAGDLSNLASHAFVLDGVACASMEGFLQSLKIEDADEQEHMCGRRGAEARGRGRHYDWTRTGTLWWRCEPIDRLSQNYQVLLDRAYEALFAQSPRFRAALAATADAPLAHTIGKDDPTETILTRAEFCGRLARLRALLRDGPPVGG
jgi:predicted NAD-dependent protein-ADP-ribosyltransferase YbiA (DUF1768 family)